jgi:hypothetical protein
MCILPSASAPVPPAPAAPAPPAKLLAPHQRQELALEALTAARPISQLAQDHRVSRRFVYRQAATAQHALDGAFAPAPPDDRRVLFQLPVTKAWLNQLTLGLLLICHSSYRGVTELLRDLFNYPTSVGHVHDVVRRAVGPARAHNARQDLSGVRIGAHDELFQAGWPVLVGADVASTYCYLLSREEQRDADTWAVRLWELQDRGFHPDATIADAGSGLRAGHALALPATPCRGDVFHALQACAAAVTAVDSQAYRAMATRNKLEQQQSQSQQRRGRRDPRVAQRLRHARPAEVQAITLADEVALLLHWLQDDILAVAGPPHADRCALYDFVVAELRSRAARGPQRLRDLCVLLKNQRDDLLAFAAQLDRDVAALAQQFRLAESQVRALLASQALGEHDPRRWPQEAALRQQLRGRFHAVSAAVADLARQAVRASSVIENLNSRLRNYFFLRRQLGPDYLALLQFFLNHRRFLRSEHPERQGKSPAELLTGRAHPHWLELLGYTPFSRN